MLERFAVWNRWLGQHMFILVLSALLIGFLWSPGPTAFLNTLLVALFAYMTFMTALGTSMKEFINILSKPHMPLWSLLLVHVGAPAVAWVIGMLFYPNDLAMRLGFLITASIPVGVTSIMWTSIINGDVALALMVVTLDTFIVPVWLPTFFLVIAGQTVHIGFWRMIVQLFMMVTLPSLAGMLINDVTRGKPTKFAKSVGGVTAKLGMFGVIVINAAEVGPDIHWNISMVKMLFVVLLLVICGYSLGFLGSYIYRKPKPETIGAMIYNVGLRNISFGSVLALTYFSPAVAIPVTLGMLFQQPMAATIGYFWSRSKFAQGSMDTEAAK